MMVRIVGIIATLVVLFTLTLTGAVAHVKDPGSDSENGGELEIGDLTHYDTERVWAISKWNALNPVWVHAASGGGIDLVMDDYNDCFDGNNAYYDPNSDFILFNDCNLAGDSADRRKHTAMHEVGHALGLSHSFSNQIMAQFQNTLTSLQAHDICSYDVYWNGLSPCSCGDPCFLGGGS